MLARLMPRFERLLSGSTNGRKEHIAHDQLGQFKRLYHVADKVIGQLSRDGSPRRPWVSSRVRKPSYLGMRWRSRVGYLGSVKKPDEGGDECRTILRCLSTGVGPRGDTAEPPEWAAYRAIG